MYCIEQHTDIMVILGTVGKELLFLSPTSPSLSSSLIFSLSHISSLPKVELWLINSFHFCLRQWKKKLNTGSINIYASMLLGKSFTEKTICWVPHLNMQFDPLRKLNWKNCISAFIKILSFWHWMDGMNVSWLASQYTQVKLTSWLHDEQLLFIVM